jgi:hypothetical protein
MINPFLDVGIRVGAFALGVYTSRDLWNGYVERKVRSIHANTTIIDVLLDWSERQVFCRDTAPIQYWMEMGIQTIGMLACFITVIVGWYQPAG